MPTILLPDFWIFNFTKIALTFQHLLKTYQHLLYWIQLKKMNNEQLIWKKITKS